MILEERGCKEWTRGGLHVGHLVWKDIPGLLDPLEVHLHNLSVNVSHQLEKRRTDILRTATLHTARISCRTIGVGLVAILFGNFSILLWVRIHDHTNHAEFLRSLNLEATEDATIFCKSNLALERHVGRNEILKVMESPEIDVHIRRSNISTS
jgi:hypothetical protein